MRRVLVPVLAATVLLAGCSSAPERKPAAVTAKPTPIARLNTGSMKLAKVKFCSLVPASAVRDALGGRSSSQRTWKNGDKASLEEGLTDVVHEFGCRYARGRTSATAWIFARPVALPQARQIVRDGGRHQGCTVSRGPGFGRPSQRQVCTEGDGTHRVRVAGLIGDTWLGCEVAGPSAVGDLSRRTNAWCVEIANAVNTTR